MTISSANTNNLSVQCPTTYLDETIATPATFSALTTFMDNVIGVEPSPDSHTIKLAKPFAQCSESATRNGAASAAAINLTLISLIFGLIIFELFNM
jgi:hypothetical protein